MKNLEYFINAYNVAPTIRYLLNLDLNAVNERTIKIGIANIIDIDQAKKLFTAVLFMNNIYSSQNENLVKQAVALTRILNEEAKQSLIEFLAQQDY